MSNSTARLGSRAPVSLRLSRKPTVMPFSRTGVPLRHPGGIVHVRDQQLVLLEDAAGTGEQENQNERR